ncbi:unnamed protein product [Calicophoron daubneyi]|uniref:Minichromosome maintenance 8 n=1 Tax=Calicophoron daubneyi TaxID=300641 RepID=A0AAV2TP66_CALDB
MSIDENRGRRPYQFYRGFRGRRSSGSKRGSGVSEVKRKPSPIGGTRHGSGYSQTESLSSDAFSSPFTNSKAQPIVSLDENCPFPGWLLYFPTREFDRSSKANVYTKAFMEFAVATLRASGYDPCAPVTATSVAAAPDAVEKSIPVDWIRVETQGSILIDYPSLISSPAVIEKVPQIKQILGEDESEGGPLVADQCEIVVQSLGLAIHTLCYNSVYKGDSKVDFFKVERGSSVSDRHLPSFIAGRIINHSPTTPLGNLRAHHIGKFLSVRGIVVRIGHIEPVCRRLVFECAQCAATQIFILPPDGRYAVPTRCFTKGCRSRCFEPLLNNPDTVTDDTQLITVQEASELETGGACSTDTGGPCASSIGRSPRCLICRLTRDLVDLCIPGDVVNLTGSVGLIDSEGVGPSTSSTSSSSWSGRRGSTMFNLVLNVNSLVKVSGCGNLRGSNRTGNLLVLTARRDSEDDHNVTAKINDIGSALSSLDSDFSIKELYAIREISEQPNLFRLLVASLCPNICGRGLVKAGLLLALFGGTQQRNRRKRRRQSKRTRPSNDRSQSAAVHNQNNESPDSMSVSYRLGISDVDAAGAQIEGAVNGSPSLETDSDPDAEVDKEDEEEECPTDFSSFTDDFGPMRRSASHVLVVGDPGLGKSEMLRAAASLAPRVIYVCGNTASAAGLTVSTVREGSENGGGFGLEAGALVLADQGCCCIDEFDKLACDPAVLLEAMEQQTISVARGGLVANLPARAAVLAAANPVGGHYDSTRRLEENLRIAPALLSRFDLIFVLLDRPDEVADRLLSEHVTAVHTGAWKPGSFTCTQGSQPPLSQFAQQPKQTVIELDPSAPLAERLELRLGEQLDFIPPVLLRKYILYARKYVMPSLSTEAALCLRDFYLELRQGRHIRDTFPVTMRQLESLVRLTEARARAELRETATKEDAEDACELMRSTGLGTGHVGGTPANATLSQIARMVPAPRRSSSASSVGPAAAKRLLKALQITSQKTNSRLFTQSELRTLVTGLGFSAQSLDDLLSHLNEAGAILKQSPSLYRLV